MFHLIFNIGRSDLRMFAWNVYRHASWSTCSRLVQKQMEKNMFSLRKRLTIFWSFWLPVVGGDTFSPLAPILGPEKKVAMSPSLTVRGGEYDTNMCDNRMDGASGIYLWGREFPSARINKRPKLEKLDLPLRPQATGTIDYTRNTSRDVLPSSRSSAVSPLGFRICLKVVPLLLPAGSSIIRLRYVASGMWFKRRKIILRPNSTPCFKVRPSSVANKRLLQ